MKRQWILITAMALTLVVAISVFGCKTEPAVTAIPAAAQPQAAAPVTTGTEPITIATYPLGVNPSGLPLFESGLWPQGKSQPAAAVKVDGGIILATYPLGVNPSGLPLFEGGLVPQGATMRLDVPAPVVTQFSQTTTTTWTEPIFLATYPLGVNPSGLPLFDGWQH